MSLVRLPLVATLGSRSSTPNKDPLTVNCYPEKQPDGQAYVIRRFGYRAQSQYTAGQALGLFTYNTQPVSVIGTTARLGASVLGTVNANSQYQFTTTGANTGFFLKNNDVAYTYDGSAFAPLADGDYPSSTVPGVVYLDGFVFVLTLGGRVYNSDVNAPTAWDALSFISTQDSDNGSAIARYGSYVVAFGQNNTTLFYNAANPTASPLLPNKSAQINIGCANGNSVVQTENTIFWIGQTRQKGRSVYHFNGLVPEAISDPFVDRILANDPLTTVYAYFTELNGHGFYVMTLKASNITLVYDTLGKQWMPWTSSALGLTRSVTNATIDDHVVTLTIPNHGLQNGTVGLVSGNASPTYLGQFIVNVIDGNTISYTANTSAVRGGINAEEINKREINANNIS